MGTFQALLVSIVMIAVSFPLCWQSATSRLVTVRLVAGLFGYLLMLCGFLGYIFSAMMLAEELFSGAAGRVVFSLGAILAPFVLAAIAHDVRRRGRPEDSPER